MQSGLSMQVGVPTSRVCVLNLIDGSNFWPNGLGNPRGHRPVEEEDKKYQYK